LFQSLMILKKKEWELTLADFIYILYGWLVLGFTFTILEVAI